MEELQNWGRQLWGSDTTLRNAGFGGAVRATSLGTKPSRVLQAPDCREVLRTLWPCTIVEDVDDVAQFVILDTA